MTFPYPLTPEVRADLWRFMGLPPEAAATMTVPPVLPVLALIPRNGDEDTVYKLTDTPFARAFVAWREGRMAPREPDGTIRNVGGGLAVFSITLTTPPPHIGPDPVDVTARTQTLSSKVTP